MKNREVATLIMFALFISSVLVLKCKYYLIFMDCLVIFISNSVKSESSLIHPEPLSSKQKGKIVIQDLVDPPEETSCL